MTRLATPPINSASIHWISVILPRTRKAHWGPIEKHEVDIRREADEMLKDVQALVENWTGAA